MLKVWKTLCTLCMVATASMVLISLVKGYDYWTILTIYWFLAVIRDMLDIAWEVYVNGRNP